MSKPCDLSVEVTHESLEQVTVRLHELERQNAKLRRVRQAATALLVAGVPVEAEYLQASDEWWVPSGCIVNLAAALEALETDD